jgi:ABC-2 type transport system permease protein
MNLALWPMMAFSGVFFSLEGTLPVLQKLSRIFPLTHYIEAARAIMLDGAGIVDIMPNLIVLLGMTALFLLLSSLMFKWE